MALLFRALHIGVVCTQSEDMCTSMCLVDTIPVVESLKNILDT